MRNVVLLERLEGVVTGRALRSDALAGMVCRPFGSFCHGAPSRWDRTFLSRSVRVRRSVLLRERLGRCVTGRVLSDPKRISHREIRYFKTCMFCFDMLDSA